MPRVIKMWIQSTVTTLCLSIFSYSQTVGERAAGSPLEPLAVVVSLSGKPAANALPLRLRDLLDANEAHFKHSFKSDLGVVLSNQISLHSSEGSDWTVSELSGTIERGNVRPWLREPTQSKTEISINEGSLAFFADHLNDQSVFEISTPHGTLRVSSAKGIVQVQNRIVRVSIESGLAWFSNEYSTSRLVLGENDSIELSDTNSLNLDRIERLPWERNKELLRQLEIVEANARRVFFPLNQTATQDFGSKVDKVAWLTPSNVLDR